jgi:hypothetical protein
MNLTDPVFPEKNASSSGLPVTQCTGWISTATTFTLRSFTSRPARSCRRHRNELTEFSTDF